MISRSRLYTQLCHSVGHYELAALHEQAASNGLIISPPQSIGLSNCSPSRSIFGYAHPAPASRPAKIVTPPVLRASYTTFTATRSPFQNSFTPTAVGPTARMARVPHNVCYVGDFSLPNHLVSYSIPQRNPEHSSFHSSLSDLELVDQPCRECPRLGYVAGSYLLDTVSDTVCYTAK
jgi:hypothetical protein